MTFDVLKMDRVAKAITGEVARPDYGTPEEIVAGALWAAYSVVRHNHPGNPTQRQARFLELAQAVAADIESQTGVTH